MKISKGLLGVLVVSVVIGTGLLAGTAYAQGNNPPTEGATPPAPGFRGRGPGRGIGPVAMLDGEHPLHDYIMTAVSEALNLDIAELESRLEAGETMVDIALSTGLSQEESQTLLRDAHQAALGAAQADGIELPAFGPRADGINGDCPMDGSGRPARGGFGMHGFAGPATSP